MNFLTYTISSDAFVHGICNNKTLNEAIEKYGFLVGTNVPITLGKFADIITEIYHAEKDEEVIFLRKYKNIKITIL